jgi:uncharacterized alpha-E superfamily protein
VAVLQHEEEGIVPPPPPRRAPLPVRRATGEFPSRVADDFYWLGRYLERLEGQARLGRAALARAGRGAELPRDVAEVAVLARCLAEAGVPVPEGVIAGLHAALLPGGALTDGMDAIGRLMDGLRDRFTGEMHGALRQALRVLRTTAARGGADAISRTLATATRVSLLAAGIAAEGMVRAGGWRFLDLGRRIERAQTAAFSLALVLDQPAARIEGALGLALELGDALVTYQTRYGAAVQPGPALDLLIADPDNPRSIAFQFARAASLLGALAGGGEATALAEALRARAEGIAAEVRGAADPAVAASRCPPMLRTVETEAWTLSDEVTRRFFTLLPRPRVVGMALA